MKSPVERIYSNLGALIKAARRSKGMSGAELGRYLGVTRQSIFNIEAGRQRLNFHQMIIIDTVLDTDFIVKRTDLL